MIRQWFRRRKQNQQLKEVIEHPTSKLNEKLKIPLYADFEKNRKVFKDLFADCDDVIFHPFYIGKEVQAELIYFEHLSDIGEINTNVLFPLMLKADPSNNPEYILERELPVSSAKQVKTFYDCVNAITCGNAILLIKKANWALNLGISKWEKRPIDEPENEPVIRGPKEGFIEPLRDNVALIRRKIRSPYLKTKSLHIGRYTNTQVIVSYIEGIVDPDILQETFRRLERIDIDGVLESGYIEEIIQDNPFSPFPQIQTTERVDIVTASLLEGRVAILTDGSPVVMIVPVTLPMMLQATEDYYNRFMVSTLLRWMRYFLFLASIALPSFYVAIITFHQEAVPTDQLLSFAAARERIPIPTLIEAIIMEFAFEALREAGLRLPRIIGSAVTIVGALVIGDSAVRAGLVSAPMIIVVAATGIASFTVPKYALGFSLRMLRFPLLLLSGILGIIGLMLGLLLILIHLCSLRSFGVPYLSPLVGQTRRSDLKDVLLRAPWWNKKYRPRFLHPQNQIRQEEGQRPDPEHGGES